MAYKALYRTYRPQKFSEVIGQDHIVRTLQNSLASGKISHAYLFSGPRGTGKTTVARIFAKALNCAAPRESEPCGECLSCREIAEGNSPDVVEIDAASNNGVEEIRDIRDKVKFLPSGSKYKVYIIDEVHMLSQGAFNALLKTLEEPPKHVVFILATTEPHKVLPTILSRCQRFDFKSLSVKEIAELIRKVAREENFLISEEAVIAIAEGAEGGMRDALSYLDQAASFADDIITIDDVNSVTGNLNHDKLIELATYFEEKKINQALHAISELLIMGKEVSKVVGALLQFYRDVLLYKTIDTSMFSKYIYEKEEFKALAARIDAKTIFHYVDVLSDVQTKIKFSTTPQIYLDVAVIKMINEIADSDYAGRIKALEDKIQNLGSYEADGSKINILESRIQKVVAELSRLELPVLAERIAALEAEVTELRKSGEAVKAEPQVSLDVSAELEDFAEQIRLLRSRLDALEERIEKNSKSEVKTIPAAKKISRKRIFEGQLSFFTEPFPNHEPKEKVEEAEVEAADFPAGKPESEPVEAPAEPEIGFITLDDFEESEPEHQETAKALPAENVQVAAQEEIRETEKSQLVRRIAPIQPAVEERPIIPEKPKPSPEPEAPKEDALKGLDDPEYNSFSVSVLERILHSSRTQEARDDKGRIVNLWKNLTRNCPGELLSTAQILQDGQIVAVGNREFILVYPTVALCNQVMRPKFKRKALPFLYEVLGAVYNYMAIPDNLWLEKRTEYINQYNIGIKYPKLTPFDDPRLSADETDPMSPQEKMAGEVMKLLGADIVKIE